MELWQEVFVRRLIELVPTGAQSRIAGLAGISAELISKWKNGKKVPNPTLATVNKLAHALGVPATSFLVDGEGAPSGGGVAVPLVSLSHAASPVPPPEAVQGAVTYPTEWTQRLVRTGADLVAAPEGDAILLIDRSYPNREELSALKHTPATVLVAVGGDVSSAVAIWLEPILYLRRSDSAVTEPIVIREDELPSDYLKGRVLAVTRPPAVLDLHVPGLDRIGQ